MDKIEDFGVHANSYYPLKVEIYKTKLDEQLLDLLWNKYWVATLSQSLIVSVRQRRAVTDTRTDYRIDPMLHPKSTISHKRSSRWTFLKQPRSSKSSRPKTGPRRAKTKARRRITSTFRLKRKRRL